MRRSLFALITTVGFAAPLISASTQASAATADPAVVSIFARARAVMGTDPQRQPRALHASAEMHVLGLAGSVDMRKSGRDMRFETVVGPTRELVIFRDHDMYQRDTSGLIQHAKENDLMQNLTMASLANYAVFMRPENGRRYGHAPFGSKAPATLTWVEVQSTGNPTQYYGFDPKRGWLSEIVIAHGQNPISIYLHDYRKVQQQEIPYRFELSDERHNLVAANLTRIDADAKIDPADFAPPQPLHVELGHAVLVHLVPESGNRFFVPVTIGGRTYLMHLDSASRNTILDNRIAAALHLQVDRPRAVAGLPNTAGSGYATLPGFAVGEARFPSERVVVGNLGKTISGQPIDGVAGFPFFAQAALVLNPQKATLVIARPGSSLPGGNVTMTTNRDFIDLLAEMTNGPRDVRLVLATGRADGVTLNRSFYEANLGILVPNTPHNYVPGQSPALTAILRGLTISGLPPFADLPIYVRYTDSPWAADAHVAGSVGMAFLHAYRIASDVQNSVLKLELLPGLAANSPTPQPVTPLVPLPQPSASLTPPPSPTSPAGVTPVPAASVAPLASSAPSSVSPPPAGVGVESTNETSGAGKHRHHHRGVQAQAVSSPQPGGAIPSASATPTAAPGAQASFAPSAVPSPLISAVLSPQPGGTPASSPTPNLTASPISGVTSSPMPITTPSPIVTVTPTAAASPPAVSGPLISPSPVASAAPIAPPVTPVMSVPNPIAGSAPGAESAVPTQAEAGGVVRLRHRHHHRAPEAAEAPLPNVSPTPGSTASAVPDPQASPSPTPSAGVTAAPQSSASPQLTPPPTDAPIAKPSPHAHAPTKKSAAAAKKSVANGTLTGKARIAHAKPKRPIAAPTPMPHASPTPLRLSPAAARWRARHGPWHPPHHATEHTASKPAHSAPTAGSHPHGVTTPRPQRTPKPRATPHSRTTPKPASSASAASSATPDAHSNTTPDTSASITPDASTSATPGSSASAPPSIASALPTPSPTASGH